MIYDFLRKTLLYGEVPNGFELRLRSREFRGRKTLRFYVKISWKGFRDIFKTSHLHSASVLLSNNTPAFSFKPRICCAHVCHKTSMHNKHIRLDGQHNQIKNKFHLFPLKVKLNLLICRSLTSQLPFDNKIEIYFWISIKIKLKTKIAFRSADKALWFLCWLLRNAFWTIACAFKIDCSGKRSWRGRELIKIYFCTTTKCCEQRTDGCCRQSVWRSEKLRCLSTKKGAVVSREHFRVWQ